MIKTFDENSDCEINFNEIEGLVIHKKYNMLSLFSLLVYKTVYKKLYCLEEMLQRYDDYHCINQYTDGFDPIIISKFCEMYQLNLVI